MYYSTKDNIKQLIIKKGRAVFWFTDDFSIIGSIESVRKALQCLVADGMLLRIAKGVYYYPKIDRELGLGVLYPSKEDTAKAIAKHHHLKIVPTGAFAMNALGLTTQVQTVVTFLTNGRERSIDLGDGRYIQFLHSSVQKLFDYRSYVMILVIQAMQELGEKAITVDVCTTFSRHLKNVAEREFVHDLTIAPVWAQELLKKLYEIH